MEATAIFGEFINLVTSALQHSSGILDKVDSTVDPKPKVTYLTKRNSEMSLKLIWNEPKCPEIDQKYAFYKMDFNSSTFWPKYIQ